MDEIVIDEKKYVSSKRAAKTTGYAKDYIGQLCREGRVPARLVGRSWYVLESALHDHRFGTDKSAATQVLPQQKDVPIESATYESTWESPRYESTSDDMLPPINRLVGQKSNAAQAPDQHTVDHLQHTWMNLMESVSEPQAITEFAPHNDTSVPSQDLQLHSDVATSVEPQEEEVMEDEEISIPIHSVYEVPQELLPKKSESKQVIEVKSPQESTNQGPQRLIAVLYIAIRIFALTLGVSSVVFAVIGSGYFDGEITSHRQVAKIFGIYVYTK